MMNAYKTLLATAMLAMPLSGFSQASTWKIETPHSEAEFSIRHLGVTNVRGRIRGVTGQVTWDAANPANSHVEATMDATTIDTGEPKRDAKIKGDTFFNIAKYPQLIFHSTAVKRTGDGQLQIIGDLTLAGVTKSVTLAVEGPAAPQPKGDGKTVSGFSATGTISRENFNFGQNDATLKSPIIGDEVKFTIDLEVSK
jgi:polyisoprenoid-binding protein YceI